MEKIRSVGVSAARSSGGGGRAAVPFFSGDCGLPAKKPKRAWTGFGLSDALALEGEWGASAAIDFIDCGTPFERGR